MRLRATVEHRDEGYIDAYHDDPEVIDRSLRAVGLGSVADQALRDALRRVDVFGFHLASLDVRRYSNGGATVARRRRSPPGRSRKRAPGGFVEE